MKTIGVYQNWGLGDLVMTVPVLAELRRLHPEARIVLMVHGRPQGDLLASSPLVDEILQIPQSYKDVRQIRFFARLRAERLDAVFVGTRVSPLVAFMLRVVSGVRVVVGDGNRHRFLYTVRNRISPGVHRVERMLETLALWTGVRVDRPAFPLPISDEDRRSAAARLAAEGLADRRYVAHHPGSSRGRGNEKRLPQKLVREVIAALADRDPDLRHVLLFGPADRELIAQFEPLPPQAVILSDLRLGETEAVIAAAEAFLGSDSALGHIAAALGVPTVTAVGPSDPNETRPWGPLSRVVLSREDLACRPCWFTPLHGNCPHQGRCMTEITPDQIVEALLDAVATRRTGEEPAIVDAPASRSD